LLSGKALPSVDAAPSVKKTSFSKVPGQGMESPVFQFQSGPGIPQGHSRLEAPQMWTEALARLVRSLNLPPDSLSTAIVSFARYFSLPMDPILLTRLRREVLSLNIPRESAALSATAAVDKGVKLTPEALEKYTAAIDPDARRDQKGGQEKSGRDGLPPESSGEDGKGDKPSQVSLSGIPDADELKKIRDDIDGNEPLLSILNSIPGKDGDRWMVYPFQVSAGGKRFLVSIRVTARNGKEDARLAVDIAGEDRRWLFVVNRPACPQRRQGVETAPFIDAWVSLWPPPGQRERETFEREIREALGPAIGRVILRDNESLLAECRNEALFSVNEEV
jgi:hypothetical protein